MFHYHLNFQKLKILQANIHPPKRHNSRPAMAPGYTAGGQGPGGGPETKRPFNYIIT